jgi:hypothetical protein
MLSLKNCDDIVVRKQKNECLFLNKIDLSKFFFKKSTGKKIFPLFQTFGGLFDLCIHI